MKRLEKYFDLVVLVLCFIVLVGFFSGLFAQGPPALPGNPYQVPWGNFILIAAGCLGYGIFRIIRKK